MAAGGERESEGRGREHQEWSNPSKAGARREEKDPEETNPRRGASAGEDE